MTGHGGNIADLALRAGRSAEAILDFSANINPLGAPEWLRQVVNRSLDDTVHYPDPDMLALRSAAARAVGMPPEQVVAGNGSTEILYAIPRVAGCARAIIPVPSYADYERACALAHVPVTHITMDEGDAFCLNIPKLEAALRESLEPALVFLGNPNNPTGATLSPDIVRALCAAHPQDLFVIDEAFADFCEPPVTLLPDIPENALVVRSLTKFFALPGIRLGVAYAAESWAERIHGMILPWSLGTMAQAVGARLFDDVAYATTTREKTASWRSELYEGLSSFDALTVWAGAANYLFCKITHAQMTAPELADRLLREWGMAIRVCDNYPGLGAAFFRVAVRMPEENQRLLEAMAHIFAPSRAAAFLPQRKTPALMIQGTASNAGKSVLTAAFCRCLLQDGYDVAPFKAQNMALNSGVTADGLEMGRAQIMQAQACRLAPDVRMNPVLLKPSSETGCQVIVNGKALGQTSAREYFSDKTELWRAVREAYDSLAAEHDVMMLEGAGSPGEVNLKKHDIVNMRMAAHARSAVLLAGDIDRGGVYASFIGTMDVMDAWERALVAGFLVNKFRGDASLLDDAHRYVFEYTGKPVLGVIPYMRNHGLPEEDSVSFKAGACGATRAACAQALDIAVISLPYISNFTDTDPFLLEPDVTLRVVTCAADLGCPDIVILPGSKSVIPDMTFLRETGLAARLMGCAQSGQTELIGICGGYQLLGQGIEDPHGLESRMASVQGLGLLSVTTTLAQEKTLARTTATHLASGLMTEGYEIHHGQTHATGETTPCFLVNGQPLGYASSDDMIWGTYLHGLFDNDRFRRWILNRARVRKGWDVLEGDDGVTATYDIEPALDRLAETLREHVDLEAIYRVMGLK